jgi:hypothetical protein
LGGGERNPVIIEFKQAREIKEMALRSFGAQISETGVRHEKNEEMASLPWMLASRTDATSKHQVELLGLANFISRVRI